MTTYHNLYCNNCRDFKKHEVTDDFDKKKQSITCLYCNKKSEYSIAENRVKVDKKIYEKWVEHERKSRKAS